MGIWETMCNTGIVIHTEEDDDGEENRLLKQQNRQLKQLLMQMREKRGMRNVSDSSERKGKLGMSKREQICYD